MTANDDRSTAVQLHTIMLGRQLPAETVERLKLDVSPANRRRIERFRFWQDAQRTLLGELLARVLLMEHCGLANEEVLLQTDEYGKPALAGRPDVHFNISHAGEWVAVALDGAPVGVDVEHIVPIDFAISAQYFSPPEHEELLAQAEADRLEFFFSLWTLKESYIKAVGKGLSLPLRSFSVTPIRGESAELRLAGHPSRDFHLRLFPFATGYKLAVCAARPVFPAKPRHWTVEELLTEFLQHRRR